MRFFFPALLLQSLFVGYLLFGLRRAIPRIAWPRILLRIIWLMGAALYTLGITDFMLKLLPIDWFGCIILTANLLTFILGIVALWCAVGHLLLHLHRRRYGRSFDADHPLGFKIFISLLIASATATTVAAIHRGNRNVHEPHIVPLSLDIRKPGSTEAPRRLRAAFISDIHIGENIRVEDVQRMVQMTMAEKPELILIGGDMMDHRVEFARHPEIMRLLRDELQAPYGKYYILGNHEYRGNTTDKQQWISDVGGILLCDSIVYPVDERLCLVGRDDRVNKARLPLPELMSRVENRSNRTTLLLDHQPTETDSLEMEHINLALCGHTHGGQMIPFTALVYMRYGQRTYGYLHRGNSHLYVSSGYGSAAPPFRIGTRSEIVILTLTY